MERADKVVMSTYGRQPLVLVKGEGCRVWDDGGREYLDFVAGLAVCHPGHAPPGLAPARGGTISSACSIPSMAAPWGPCPPRARINSGRASNPCSPDLSLCLSMLWPRWLRLRR